jgi:hypothetical protein
MAEEIMTLHERIDAGDPQPLVVRPHYSPIGDIVTLYFDDREAYEERADEIVTLYRARANGDLVGCKIKGVVALIRKLGAYHLEIKNSRVKLAFLFMGAALEDANPERKAIYTDLSRRYGAIEFSLEPANAA